MNPETSNCSLEDQKICTLGLAIARAVRVSRDEADALRRICFLVEVWGVKIDPGELGSKCQEDWKNEPLL